MPKELDSCVKKVKKKGRVDNPWAVCRAKLGSDKAIEKRRVSRRKKK